MKVDWLKLWFWFEKRSVNLPNCGDFAFQPHLGFWGRPMTPSVWKYGRVGLEADLVVEAWENRSEDEESIWQVVENQKYVDWVELSRG